MVEKLSQQWIDSGFAITHLSPTAVQRNCEAWYRLHLWACSKLPDLNATECLQVGSTPVYWYSVAIQWFRNAPSNELIQPLQELIFHPGPFKEIVRPGIDLHLWTCYMPCICIYFIETRPLTGRRISVLLFSLSSPVHTLPSSCVCGLQM